jgi:hypothetical protein
MIYCEHCYLAIFQRPPCLYLSPSSSLTSSNQNCASSCCCSSFFFGRSRAYLINPAMHHLLAWPGDTQARLQYHLPRTQRTLTACVDGTSVLGSQTRTSSSLPHTLGRCVICKTVHHRLAVLCWCRCRRSGRTGCTSSWWKDVYFQWWWWMSLPHSCTRVGRRCPCWHCCPWQPVGWRHHMCCYRWWRWHTRAASHR